MNRDTIRERARQLKTKQDLLQLLNDLKQSMTRSQVYPFTMRQLMRLCNPNRVSGRYKKFFIPKKSGGKREINVPCGNLKWMQMCLNEIFKSVYTPSVSAMGFVEGRSVLDNARVHVGSYYVFNIDLQDFFTSIDQARVWKRLQLEPFNFPKDVANVVAGLCAIKTKRAAGDEETSSTAYVLPQGAPTSPLLTNAICDTLDRRLNGLAKRFGLKYSRYADDITFSAMHNAFTPGSKFRHELDRIVSGQHLRINPKKTRLRHVSEHQDVTGLTVNSKANVSRKYVKDLRAILHIWERYGEQDASKALMANYKRDKCVKFHKNPDLRDVIYGKLCYLGMIKGSTDKVYVKLKRQFDALIGAPNPSPTVSIAQEQDTLSRLVNSNFDLSIFD